MVPCPEPNPAPVAAIGEPPPSADEIARLEDEIARLEAIVRDQPRTAEGRDARFVLIGLKNDRAAVSAPPRPARRAQDVPGSVYAPGLPPVASSAKAPPPPRAAPAPSPAPAQAATAAPAPAPASAPVDQSRTRRRKLRRNQDYPLHETIALVRQLEGDPRGPELISDRLCRWWDEPGNETTRTTVRDAARLLTADHFVGLLELAEARSIDWPHHVFTQIAAAELTIVRQRLRAQRQQPIGRPPS